jgi:hypothetical protein
MGRKIRRRRVGKNTPKEYYGQYEGAKRPQYIDVEKGIRVR